MDSDRWEKIQSIFERVLDTDKSNQEQLLKKLCGDDSALEAEVRSLIASDKDQLSMLEKPAVELFDFNESSSIAGTTIGQYRLIEQIGYGGMGAVYLAERSDDQFQQQVALKVIKRGMDSEEILRRFTAEREILAKLSHPNIARLYDGGISEDGLPFFTMEYIKGERIDVYCDKNNLTIEERLQLFLAVLDAVKYAQKNLIVHRDLKPGNIIVTDDGSVKLLDFGIAKLLATDEILPDSQELTKTNLRIMTPGYASPEQVKGELITTASDVYSLGVILFELLSGHRPYKTTGQSAAEVEKIILHTDPQKPSTAVLKTDETLIPSEASDNPIEKISTLRKTSPHKLRKTLNGDLDNICLKALEKEPERRYNSAEQLADDISRYLQGHPITARPASLNYKIVKFVKRNRTAVLMAAVIFIIINSLVAYFTIKLSNERDKAQLEAQKANQVAEFITSIFEVANPSQSKGETVTARELLEEGAARLDEELADQPEVQAEMYAVISSVYYSLSLLDKAKEMAEKGLQIELTIYPEKSLPVATSYHAIGDLHFDLGDHFAADTYYRKALAIKTDLLGENDTLIALEYVSLATIARHSNIYDTALFYYQRALEIQLAVQEKPHSDIAYTMNNLGRLYQKNGEPDKAEPLLKDALEQRIALFGEFDFGSIASMGSLASFYRGYNKPDESIDLYRRAIKNIIQIAGEEHFYTGGLYQSLAHVLTDQGMYGEAEELYLKSIDIITNNLPAGHVNRAFPLTGLGKMYIRTDRPEKARPILEEAYQLCQKTYASDNITLKAAQSYYGKALSDLNSFSEAEPLLREAFEFFKVKFDITDKKTQETLGYLLELYTRTQNEDALQKYKNLQIKE